MLNYSLFSKMRKNAAFINTGRGAQVVEEGLARAMREEPGRTALLDVTFPDPVLLGTLVCPALLGTLAWVPGKSGASGIDGTVWG